MSTTIRTFNEQGELTGIRIITDSPYEDSTVAVSVFADQFHPALAVTGALVLYFQARAFYQEQIALNKERTGANLVDEETTRHILEGDPITRTFRVKNQEGKREKTTTVVGWSGGHGNPDAAKYGKTQIPSFWTNDRFMYEVSDVLSDKNTRWFRQDASPTFEPDENAPERYVCVETRSGVPIRIVADRIDDKLKCITAFPDYGDLPIEQRFGVEGIPAPKKNEEEQPPTSVEKSPK